MKPELENWTLMVWNKTSHLFQSPIWITLIWWEILELEGLRLSAQAPYFRRKGSKMLKGNLVIQMKL